MPFRIEDLYMTKNLRDPRITRLSRQFLQEFSEKHIGPEVDYINCSEKFQSTLSLVVTEEDHCKLKKTTPLSENLFRAKRKL